MSPLAPDDLNKLRSEELLELRFCELPISVRDSPIERRVARLFEELDDRELLRPHVWLSEEWFTPDGVSGFAIPFYLAHPRLTRLERVMMFEAEGDAEDECMRILRHEAGHALANAFRLQRTRQWKKLFGSNSIAYPQWYRPSLTSRDFVLNLNAWYAQAHPAEDFAETFAVWLRPASDWRARYKGWNALNKIEYVHHVMMAMRGRSSEGRRQEVEPLSNNRKTLGEHYLKKREFYAPEWPDSYDRNLARVFSTQAGPESPSASQVLRSVRREVCASVTARTGMHPYTVDHIMNDIIRRSRELGLRRRFSERETRRKVDALLTNQVRHALKTGYRRIPL